MIMCAMICSGLLTQFSCKEKDVDSTEAPAVEETVVTVEMLEPDDDFGQALVAFANKDFATCDKMIRKGAKSMEAIAALATGERKVMLDNSIAELNELATEVAADRVDGIDDLNYFFGRAGHALAGYKMDITDTYFDSRSPQETGEALSALVDRLEANIKYYKREITTEEKTALEDAKALAQRLRGGEKVAKEDIKKSIDNLGAQVKKWDDEFNHKK
jgi:hypothetical protein